MAYTRVSIAERGDRLTDFSNVLTSLNVQLFG
jgi:hypothetical protein